MLVYIQLGRQPLFEIFSIHAFLSCFFSFIGSLDEGIWDEMVSNTERLASDSELLQVDFVVAWEWSLLEAKVTRTAALLSPSSRKFRPHYPAILRRFKDGHGLYKLSMD